MKKYLNLSTFYLILGLAFGVFYREFTKMNSFEGVTVLDGIHSHILILGFIFFLVILLLEKSFKISSVKSFNKWLIFYNVSFIYMIISLTIRGIMQVNGSDFAGLSHIAGLSHVMLGGALIWFIVIANKALRSE
ncbi:DUF2871 domain-containing protein [Clostridium septicum]|uniref:DUF2871 domain-containing protein n=1 Tax=Clostridium septicum TaxID=1504 RepID=A0A9N7JJM5_CLOSE|nr:DUF2871 domain-containing protein [Clostridium septicum]AYE33550.1 DUF2871 domain-containing protein [Clostridium septicum]MDU1313824.1 DUF2871 domain-containing protein [Clostridium septicum]QAS61713.1 DUF2871 domain-containing protein [Clostridium septicum]UEC21840.1 DUF2871 domain-containing protein [Clostridium septicum]USS00107.1 DUF2871 domain-containing protein [Clostridium septicum]